ncbi:MAG: fused MFS/spermidine synthase [bacterium]
MLINFEASNLIFTKANTDKDNNWRLRLVIVTLFFFSGVAGLIYEVVWNRMLMLVFGSTVFAASTVLTAFMAGMAIGSFFFGRLADRRKDNLNIYAYLEAGIGIYAILLPFILSATDNLYIIIHRNLQSNFYLLSFIRFLICLIILIIPTTLMGGTLPIISKVITSRMSRSGWNIGLLYSINTFGAVLGCFLTGFILIRLIGILWTIYISAGINIIIALIILLILHRKTIVDFNIAEEESEESSLPAWIGKIALLVFGLSGFCALAYEVLWTRVLVLFLGYTTYAFATMLSSFLCGIALGSIVLARLIDKRKSYMGILGPIQLFIALSAVLLIPMFGSLYSVGMKFTGADWLSFIISKYSMSFLVMLVPTTLMGATFPIVTKIYARSYKELGKSIGNIYSINTIGSILGSFLAGFLIIPFLGIQKGIIIIAFINAFSGILVIIASIVHDLSQNKPLNFSFRIPVVTISILIIIVAIIAINLDQPLISITPIFKGSGKDNKLLFYKEDIDACVTVVEDTEGVRRIFVDTNQAAEDSRWDLPSHSIIGHLPILLHPNPKNALVIGFGMGVTSWSISRHGVKVDAVEISPGVVSANSFFTKINHNVLNDPLINLTIDDGRNYTLTTDKKYDMISTGIIHPLVSANSASFYTKDFYELCKKRMTSDGIMCQWVPLHRLPEDKYKMIIRTFKASFPHTTLWYKFTPDFVILIGTPNELSINYQDFKKRMEKPEVKEDLALVNMSDPIALLDSFMMDERTIDQYTGPGHIHTDMRPRMEFFGPYTSVTTYQNLLGMRNFRTSVLPYLTNMGNTPQELNELRDKIQQYFDATQYTITGQLYYVNGNFDDAMRRFLAASAVNPEDTNVKWLITYVEKQMGITEQALLDRIKENKSDADAHIKLGTVYQNQGQLDKAINEFKKAIEINPNSMLARSSLAYIYESQGRFAEAIEEMKEVARIKPDLPQVYVSLGLLYDRQSMYDNAISEFKKALQLEPNSALALINLGIVYRKKGMIDEAINHFNKVTNTQSDPAIIHGILGDLYREKGDLTKAEAELKKAMQLDPRIASEPNFIITLALVYYDKGMYKEAEEQVKKAINIDPNNQSYHDFLSEIQKKR